MDLDKLKDLSAPVIALVLVCYFVVKPLIESITERIKGDKGDTGGNDKSDTIIELSKTIGHGVSAIAEGVKETNKNIIGLTLAQTQTTEHITSVAKQQLADHELHRETLGTALRNETGITTANKTLDDHTKEVRPLVYAAGGKKES